MRSPLTRREFVKLCGLSLGTLAFHMPLDWTQDQPQSPLLKGRITTRSIYIYQEPDFKSDRVGTLSRDQIVNFYEEVSSPYGPAYNPRWYRLDGGYVHSAYVQRVEGAHLNEPLTEIPEQGQLGEITVAYTQSVRRVGSQNWAKLYRLYYVSVHWITGIEQGPDGSLWYELTDDLLHVRHFVPAAHVRPIHPDEISPISADVPPEEKRIEISLADQTLTAYEGSEMVLHTRVSTGIHIDNPPNGIPTDTPRGRFFIQTKFPSRHMGDGRLNSDINAYELPGVPWTSVFHEWGVALHGTYWHDNFGRIMSHGCVNMRNADAKWIYRWTTPIAGPQDWFARGNGTLIKVY